MPPPAYAYATQPRFWGPKGHDDNNRTCNELPLDISLGQLAAKPAHLYYWQLLRLPDDPTSILQGSNITERRDLIDHVWYWQRDAKSAEEYDALVDRLKKAVTTATFQARLDDAKKASSKGLKYPDPAELSDQGLSHEKTLEKEGEENVTYRGNDRPDAEWLEDGAGHDSDASAGKEPDEPPPEQHHDFTPAVAATIKQARESKTSPMRSTATTSSPPQAQEEPPISPSHSSFLKKSNKSPTSRRASTRSFDRAESQASSASGAQDGSAKTSTAQHVASTPTAQRVASTSITQHAAKPSIAQRAAKPSITQHAAKPSITQHAAKPSITQHIPKISTSRQGSRSNQSTSVQEQTSPSEHSPKAGLLSRNLADELSALQQKSPRHAVTPHLRSHGFQQANAAPASKSEDVTVFGVGSLRGSDGRSRGSMGGTAGELSADGHEHDASLFTEHYGKSQTALPFKILSLSTNAPGHYSREENATDESFPSSSRSPSIQTTTTTKLQGQDKKGKGKQLKAEPSPSSRQSSTSASIFTMKSIAKALEEVQQIPPRRGAQGTSHQNSLKPFGLSVNYAAFKTGWNGRGLKRLNVEDGQDTDGESESEYGE